MYDLCGIGDVLVDFIPTGQYTADKPIYQCEPGGTIANLVAAAAKLGLSSMLIGKVGDDCMGRFILRQLKKYGVSLQGCIKDPKYFTTQSFVSLDAKGERSFNFSRAYGADVFLNVNEIRIEEILKAAVIAFSGMSLTDDPIRAATFTVLKKASTRGIPIVFDLNYREPLWENVGKMREIVKESLRYITLFKASEDEIMLLTEENDIKDAVKKIAGYGCKIIIVTFGEKGSLFYNAGRSGNVESFKVKTVDTTGAGDSFFAGLLFQVKLRGGFDNIKADDFYDILRFANAVGALGATKRGGVNGAPTLCEVRDFLATQNK